VRSFFRSQVTITQKARENNRLRWADARSHRQAQAIGGKNGTPGRCLSIFFHWPKEMPVQNFVTQAAAKTSMNGSRRLCLADKSRVALVPHKSHVFVSISLSEYV